MVESATFCDKISSYRIDSLINRTTPNSVQNTEKQNAQRSEGTQCCRQRCMQILKGCQDLKEGTAPGGPDVCLVAQSCPTLCNPVESSPPGSSVHGDSPGKNNGVGCHALLQGIFPTQGLNPGLLLCRQILYHLSHQGRPLRNNHEPLIYSHPDSQNV